MIADRFAAKAQLGEADFVLGAVVLQLGEIAACATKGNFQRLDTSLQLGALGTQFQDSSLGLGTLLLPGLNTLGKRG